MKNLRRAILLPLTGAILLTACAGSAAEPEAATTPGLPCLEDPAAQCRGMDFEGLDLTAWNLAGRDLAYSDLDGAILTGVDLSTTNLFGASLRGANLRGANLNGSELYAADVRDADLAGVDLTGANLTETNFYGADLTEADLDGTLLLRTSFGDANLNRASVENAVVTRIDLRGADTSESAWTNSVTRKEYAHAEELEALGAIVCGFAECSKEVTTTNTGEKVAIDPEMFRFAMIAQMRTALAYLADPPGLSRHVATSMLGASGVYEFDMRVQGWEDPDVTLPEGLQDIAALYALNNVSIAQRFNTEDPTRNTILQPTEGPRDTILWRATETVPEVRAAVVYAATLSSVAALARSANDGFKERVTTYDIESGQWQPTPPGFAPALQPGWGQLRTFGETSRQCRAGAPEIGADDVQEVIEIAENLTRDQKNSARFWDDERIRTTTPIGHWHDIAAQLVRTKMKAGEIVPRDAIRLMTEVHMAMADAMIMVWYEKYTYRTARPITVIRETDEYWNSYLGNPPFPAYPSGHAAVSAAASEVLARGLGEFEFTDDRFRGNSGAVETLNSAPRTYPNVRVAAEEAALSRVWGGIHFLADSEGGRRIGLCTADVHTER